MFSIIISVHDASQLRPVFYSMSKEAELIIIDSLYNLETKDKLKDLKYNFKKIIYAPQKKIDNPKESDYLNGLNTGLAYAEGPWCLTLSENSELKPDFFEKLKESISLYYDLYKNRFVIRPIELEPSNNDVRWNSYVKLKQRYFFLPCSPLGASGSRQYIPIITCGSIIAHLDTWFFVNGFDEKYDVGHCWYDNDLFDKFVIMRIPIILDQQLMIYKPYQKNIVIGRELCKKIYDESIEDKKNGHVYSPNSFDLPKIHEEYLKEKDKYII